MNEEQEAAELEAAKKSLLMKILTKDAYERLGRVRMSNSMVAAQLELYLIQVYQSGQLAGSITDEKLKQILSVLTTDKKKTKIKRVVKKRKK